MKGIGIFLILLFLSAPVFAKTIYVCREGGPRTPITGAWSKPEPARGCAEPMEDDAAEWLAYRAEQQREPTPAESADYMAERLRDDEKFRVLIKYLADQRPGVSQAQVIEEWKAIRRSLP